MTATGPRRSPVDRPREVAFEVVRAVTERHAYANLVLPDALRSASLSGRDAAFATELTYGTLRRQGTYDAIIDACVRPAGRAVDPAVRDLLRLGSHQLLGMNVPAHAAVSTTVTMTSRHVGRGAAGFVNAILRRVGSHSSQTWLQRLADGLDPHSNEAIGLTHAHPPWLVAALRDALAAHGRPSSELAELLAIDNVAPHVTLAALPGRCDIEELLSQGARRGQWSPFAVTIDGDPGAVSAVSEGRARVQDEGSQLVAAAVPEVTLPGPDTDWLDMCAGPGGKAALMAAFAGQRGAALTAWEVKPHRARLMEQSLGDLSAIVTTEVRDAAHTEGDRRVGQFDRVLLDAPCSGAGALRRRPEARWRRQPADVEQLADQQRRLLEAALRWARPGGLVAYVTCSPLRQETLDVVAGALSAHPDVRHLDARAALPSHVTDVGEGPDVQLWPHLHGTEAMYLALLRTSSTASG